MKFPLKRKWLAYAGLILALVGMLVGFYLSMARMPEFYRQALLVSPAENALAGREFEGRLADLINQARNEESWSVHWTGEQMNGWLAELPQKFPGALPASLIRPRVALAEQQFQVAFQVELMWFRGVVEMHCELFATDVGNQIALRFQEARCGFFPIPVAWWADQVQQSLAAWDIGIEWTELEDDPVALINLPSTFGEDDQRRIVLRAIQVSPTAIAIAGQSFGDQLPSELSAAETKVDNVQRSGDSLVDPRFK